MQRRQIRQHKQRRQQHQQQQQQPTISTLNRRLTTTPPLLVVALILLTSILASLAWASPTQVAQPVVISASAGNGGGQQQQQQPALEAKGIFKRSFAGLGCLGVYDKAKFARLDRVCEECYTLYREPDIHSACRQDCFRNSVFTRCVDALLLSHEAKKFDEMVDELYGK